MKTYICLVVGTTLLFAFANSNPNSSLRDDLQGVTLQLAGNGDTSLAVVNGVSICDNAPGQASQWRVEGVCSANSNCTVVADGQAKKVELDFTPSVDISSVGLIVINIFANNTWTVFANGTIADSPVTAGTEYTLKADTIANMNLLGETIAIQLVLNDDSNRVTDICAQAFFQFVQG